MCVCVCVLCADDAEEGLNDHDDGSIKENFREQDIYLPIANVARIMKNAVPQTGKVRERKKQEQYIFHHKGFRWALFCITFIMMGDATMLLRMSPDNQLLLSFVCVFHRLRKMPRSAFRSA